MTLRVDAGVRRADLIDYLEQNKIGTRLLFAGNLTRQPYMVGKQYRIHGVLPNTDAVMERTFWVGTYPGLGEEELEYVAVKLETFFGVNF